MTEIASNYEAIVTRVRRESQAAWGDSDRVCLIAVSKNQPIEAIQALYDLGHRVFGESRLQEAEPKIDALPMDIEWHFIGKLQSNKARRVGELFDVIHTLETDSQLSQIEKGDAAISGLIEINIAEEAQKTGIFALGLDDYYQKLIQCKRILFRGLMTIGPALEDPELMRPYFAKLRELNEGMGEWLSMGMSHDFEVAIQEGATHVRVGTALFGARKY